MQALAKGSPVKLCLTRKDAQVFLGKNNTGTGRTSNKETQVGRISIKKKYVKMKTQSTTTKHSDSEATVEENDDFNFVFQDLDRIQYHM